MAGCSELSGWDRQSFVSEERSALGRLDAIMSGSMVLSDCKIADRKTERAHRGCGRLFDLLV